MHNTPKNGCNPLKYKCFDQSVRNQFLLSCSDSDLKQHLEELYSLIEYQMITINDQRREIVSLKHNNNF